MCDKCTQLEKIAHYSGLALRITDQQTLDGIAGLIKEMTAEKAVFLCKPMKK